jgi:hypothetical protein
MELIGEYHNSGYLALADAVLGFFDRRTDLQRPGLAFGGDRDAPPDKVSTDISLVGIDRSDPEANALEGAILQRYPSGEGFRRWHCDWSFEPELSSPSGACWCAPSTAIPCRREAPNSTGRIST